MNVELPERLIALLPDRYRLQRVLGSDGMATVYLAADRKHGRQVAIKVLHPELAATIGSERFLREIEIAARLNHPHILPLYDSDSSARSRPQGSAGTCAVCASWRSSWCP